MNTEKDNAAAGPRVWTEVNYHPENYNPFVKTPLLDRSTLFSLCREGREPEQVRQSFVVFRQKGGDEWEDEAPIGRIEAMVLGDDDEEVQPVEVCNLGIAPDRFLTMVRQNGEATVFQVSWPHGEVTLKGAKTVDDGYEVRKADFADGHDLTCTLTPADGGAPFTLHLQLPFAGFNLCAADGSMVVGDLEVPATELPGYTYKFVGSEGDDRFAVSLDDLSQAYQYIWYEDGTLSVRDQRKGMAKVGEVPAQGKLTHLLMGSRNALIKHKDTRWRITVAKAHTVMTDEGMTTADPVELSRHVFSQLLKDGTQEDQLAETLLLMEDHLAFQWFWLRPEDWSYEHLTGLIDLDGVDQNQQKMMEQALRYNRFDAFMQRLRRLSLAQQTPVQADALQMRNNKRKIARCISRLDRHGTGEEPLWTLDVETRQENLHFFKSFHSAFEAYTSPTR